MRPLEGEGSSRFVGQTEQASRDWFAEIDLPPAPPLPWWVSKDYKGHFHKRSETAICGPQGALNRASDEERKTSVVAKSKLPGSPQGNKSTLRKRVHFIIPYEDDSSKPKTSADLSKKTSGAETKADYREEEEEIWLNPLYISKPTQEALRMAKSRLESGTINKTRYTKIVNSLLEESRLTTDVF